MFSVPINTSPLVTPAADEIFQNIKGTLFRNDVSFLATARMLLYGRLPEEESAEIFLSPVSYETIRDCEADTLLSTIVREAHGTEPRETNVVYVVPVRTDGEAQKKLLGSFMNDAKEISGMGAEPAVEAFFNQLMTSHVWIDFEKSRTLILTDRMTPAKWHAIASLTSRYFKRYFADKPVTEEEREIPFSLCNEDNPDKFQDLMRDFASQFDFRSAGIRSALHGFENKNIKQRLHSLDEKLRRQNESIENANRRYVELIREKRNLEENRSALALGVNEDEDELMNYFLQNKNISLVNVDDDGVRFFVKTPFANFNSDLAESIISNPNRADRVEMYFRGDRQVTTEDRDLLFKALMVDRTIRVWLFGEFRVSTDSSEMIDAYSRFNTPDEMADCCPNPHLNFHACMGENQRAAIEAAMSGDYVLAVEQCIGAVASVNLNETITSGPWMEDLLSDEHGRIFELNDGRRMKFSDVMKYLKEENK